MLNDAVAAELPYLRREAESLMVDALLVEHPTGETTIDGDSLEEVPVYEDIYSGKGRVQRPGSLSPREDVAGGFEFGIRAIIAQLPLSATGIVQGDRVTVTAVGPLTDPDLIGLVATVGANLTKTHPTKRTLVCEEVS